MKRRRLAGPWIDQWRIVAWLLVLSLFLPAVGQAAQRLSPRKQKDGSAVRRAFREVVAAASSATVRVKCDGGHVALGAIVDPSGWILTKASELDGAITCRLKDGRVFPARIVGVHRAYDLAMLKVDAEGLPTIRWSEPDDPAVGQWVAVPGLDDLPVAVGMISVGRRRIPPRRGVLGVAVADADPGARITQIFPNSGAEKAGLQQGDVIVGVADRDVSDRKTLTNALGRFRPGDILHLRIVRQGQEMIVQARLGDPLSRMVSRGGIQNRMGGELSGRRDGFPAVLQHDTVLQPVDCGGPLVDLDGRVVGINIARAGRTETYAIPTGEILPLLDELKSGKLAPVEPGPISPPAPPLPTER